MLGRDNAFTLNSLEPCSMQAAVTVARRVAEEQGTEIGHRVGYAVRFEERSSPETRIKYLTGQCPWSCTLR